MYETPRDIVSPLGDFIFEGYCTWMTFPDVSTQVHGGDLVMYVMYFNRYIIHIARKAPKST